MSHTSSIKAVKITSVTALNAAVAALVSRGIQCSLEENATPRAYFQNQQGMGKADFVVKLPNARYDVGLYKQADGSYEARTDFYGGSVAACLGGKATTPERHEQAQLGLLFQEYGAAVTIEAARKKGHMVRRIFDSEKQRITLEVTGAGL